jgi:hypothetical protein
MPLCIPQKCACISAPSPALLARIFTRRGFARRAPLPTRSTRTDTNCLFQCLGWYYIIFAFLWQKLAALEVPEFWTAKITQIGMQKFDLKNLAFVMETHFYTFSLLILVPNSPWRFFCKSVLYKS